MTSHVSSAAPASSTSLGPFISALESVYGPLTLSSLPAASLSTWTPPSTPGAGGHRGRYLWTDAFGVLCLLTLQREATSNDTGEHGEQMSPAGSRTSGSNESTNERNRYLILAKRLVDSVHSVLGRTRDGTTRLPGATDSEPLAGGLRIGKEATKGPDGDGQYHHYLTLWMFALNRLSIAADDAAYNDIAISLARAIHPRFFLNRGEKGERMVWKISMDMEEVLVGSEGNLDPLDGLVVFRLLQARKGQQEGEKKEVLREEIGDYQRIVQRKFKGGRVHVGNDMLDLGMSLWTAQWLKRVPGQEWAEELGRKCMERLRLLFQSNYLTRQPPQYRLAFREFGTCLGIQSYCPEDVYLRSRAKDRLDFWERNMDRTTPEDLMPITKVMYAAALMPGAFRKEYLGTEPG